MTVEFVGQPTISGLSSTGLKQRRFVVMGTSGGLKYPTVGQSIDGVLFADSSTKSTVNIALGVQINGVALVEAAGSTVAVGDLVSASSVGRVIAATTNTSIVGKVWSGSSGSTGRLLGILLRNAGYLSTEQPT